MKFIDERLYLRGILLTGRAHSLAEGREVCPRVRALLTDPQPEMPTLPAWDSFSALRTPHPVVFGETAENRNMEFSRRLGGVSFAEATRDCSRMLARVRTR
jgi:hypothetical protein